MVYNPLPTFLQEAEELLAEIEQVALTLGGAEAPPDAIDRLFRAFHTIKGSGGMCGLEDVCGFTHHIETLLDKVRYGEAPATARLGQFLLASGDHIRLLIESEPGRKQIISESTSQLVATAHELAGVAVEPQGALTTAPPPPNSCEATWNITFRPEPGLLASGCSPVALLRELGELGTCEVVAHTDCVPPLEELHPEVCYLWWTAVLRTVADEETIRAVFLFVEDGSELTIQKVEAAPVESANAVVPKLEVQPTADGTAANEERRKPAAKESVVRVPASRLDRLVHLVGELVMNQGRLTQVASQAGVAELTNPVQEMERLVSELRDDVLGIRMLPIGTIFGRFRRLVHDLSIELAKDVELITEGEDTELDKSILDQLGDPLVHLLRNAVDHGIESAEERAAKGKPQRGTIRLSASHAGSDVVVSISDDGRGLDRAAIRARAVERRLISADDKLSDKELFNLILMPGFSTANQVTRISGRGVGMDAVKKQIDFLHGQLAFASDLGKGTRMSITLPLTLAIIEGLLVQVGTEQYILPMAAVLENVELLRSERSKNNGRNVIAVRGELVSYVDLRQTFGDHSEPPPIEKIVIVRQDDQRVGLAVDRVIGTHQTVIQSLGRFFRSIDVVSGATIMGDGRVALILDVAAIVRYADREQVSRGPIRQPRIAC